MTSVAYPDPIMFILFNMLIKPESPILEMILPKHENSKKENQGLEVSVCLLQTISVIECSSSFNRSPVPFLSSSLAVIGC